MSRVQEQPLGAATFGRCTLGLEFLLLSLRSSSKADWHPLPAATVAAY